MTKDYHNSISYKIAKFNRERKWKLFLSYIKITRETTTLDVGFNEEEYRDTDNFIEKNYPFPNNLTALGLWEQKKFKEKYPLVKTIKYDGKVFPFSNKEFDVCWSNAVLEHVGNMDQQIIFIKEIKRVSKTAFITTPNRYFPIEIHTRTPLLHYLPKKTFDRYLKFFGKEQKTGDYMNLLSLKKIKKILSYANIYNYKIIKNKLFLFFTLDFVIIFKSK